MTSKRYIARVGLSDAAGERICEAGEPVPARVIARSPWLLDGYVDETPADEPEVAPEGGA